MIANLPLMLAAIVFIVAGAIRLFVYRTAHIVALKPMDVPVMLLLAGAWLLAAGALTVLVTFPATRYIDTANLLLAPLAIYGAARMVAPP